MSLPEGITQALYDAHIAFKYRLFLGVFIRLSRVRRTAVENMSRKVLVEVSSPEDLRPLRKSSRRRYQFTWYEDDVVREQVRAAILDRRIVLCKSQRFQLMLKNE